MGKRKRRGKARLIDAAQDPYFSQLKAARVRRELAARWRERERAGTRRELAEPGNDEQGDQK